MHKGGKDATNGLRTFVGIEVRSRIIAFEAVDNRAVSPDTGAVRGSDCGICDDCAGACRSLGVHPAWLTQSIAESLPKEEENPTHVHWHGMLGVTTTSLRGR